MAMELPHSRAPQFSMSGFQHRLSVHLWENLRNLSSMQSVQMMLEKYGAKLFPAK
jgi:hypothetical protein